MTKKGTPKVWTVLSMLEWATGYFQSHKVPDPRLSIEWLLAEVLGKRRLDLYLNFDRPLSEKELDRLRPLVRRRAQHEPLQYILGYTEFMGHRIRTAPGVLIPRPETEQLVDRILQDLESGLLLPRSGGETSRPPHSSDSGMKPEFSDVGMGSESPDFPESSSPDSGQEPGGVAASKRQIRAVDIGTGSGCIPVALVKSKNAEWICTGIDISEEALRIAGENAEQNGVSVEWIKADLFRFDSDPQLENRTFDLIVSNPPYVLPEEEESLERQVREYEPRIALFHEDPVEICRAISLWSREHLAPDGALYLECNPLLITAIRDELLPSFARVEILQDDDGKERFIRAFRSR